MTEERQTAQVNSQVLQIDYVLLKIQKNKNKG